LCISFVLDGVFQFALSIWIPVEFIQYAWIFFGFEFDSIWNLEEEDFSLWLDCLFVSKALGQRGTVDYGLGPVASLVFGAGGLWHMAGGLRPPLASPAPTSLACPHLPRLAKC
jgi:hypothetical protein